jgi:hypothetical protein
MANVNREVGKPWLWDRDTKESRVLGQDLGERAVRTIKTRRLLEFTLGQELPTENHDRVKLG